MNDTHATRTEGLKPRQHYRSNSHPKSTLDYYPMIFCLFDLFHKIFVLQKNRTWTIIAGVSVRHILRQTLNLNICPTWNPSIRTRSITARFDFLE